MLQVVDLAAASAPQAVTESLVLSGFAVVENHPVPLAELRDFYAAWDDFFVNGEPGRYVPDVKTQTGYFAPEQAETAKGGEAQDLKEYFQYCEGGKLPDDLKDMTLAYYNRLFSLGRNILNWVEENTAASLWRSLEKPLHEYLVTSHSMLRVLRYPPLTGHEPAGAIRAGAHEDINFITLLPAASQSGLEIKPRGQAWQPVDAPEGSIIINIGDMLQELTEGKLPSTTHRVVNPTGEAAGYARLTSPLFCHPEPDLRLSDRHTADSYLRERLEEINPLALKPR